MDGLAFCKTTYEIFEGIRSTPDGKRRLRARASVVEKRLVEELLPICAYVRSHYREGRCLSVCWRSGTQPFDATIHRTGALVEFGLAASSGFLEVTCAVPRKDYLMRELIGSGGACGGVDGLKRLPDGSIESNTIVHERAQQHENDSRIVVSAIARKMRKRTPYPDGTTLIVACSFARLYLQEDWDSMVAVTRCNLPERPRFDVFLYETVGGYVSNI